MIVSDKHKFVFVHAPKTGGSSMTKMLAPHIAPEIPTTGFGWQWAFHQTPMHAGVELLQEQWRGYFTFAFCRNPFTWVESCYRNGYLKVKAPFEQFVLRDLRNLRTQSDRLCVDGKLAVSYLAKFEKFGYEARFLMYSVGLPIPPVLPHELKNNVPRLTFTEPMKQAICERFADDFRLFGYPTK